jgi:hypothetical protein
VKAYDVARTMNGVQRAAGPASVTVPVAVIGSKVYVTAAATAAPSDTGRHGTA